MPTRLRLTCDNSLSAGPPTLVNGQTPTTITASTEAPLNPL